MGKRPNWDAGNRRKKEHRPSNMVTKNHSFDSLVGSHLCKQLSIPPLGSHMKPAKKISLKPWNSIYHATTYHVEFSMTGKCLICFILYLLFITDVLFHGKQKLIYLDILISFILQKLMLSFPEMH